MNDDGLPQAFAAIAAEAQRMHAAERQATLEASGRYTELLATNKLRSHLRFTYFCRRGCALLHVMTFPAFTFGVRSTTSTDDQQQVVLGWPPYKNSRTRNSAESTVAGRSANTTDGDRHWKARAALSELVGPTFSVQCDHVRVQLTVDDLQADLNLDTPKKFLPARGAQVG